MELRCPHKLHAKLVNGLIEFKCNSKFCGYVPGITVLHRFDPITGDFVETLKFKDTTPRKEESNNGSAYQHAAVRLP